MQVNEEKRKKFMEYAGKRVNNVLHDIQILEPMSRSASYDFTRQDVDEMFNAMQETLNNAKAEFEKKFEEKARSEKKVFSFGTSAAPSAVASTNTAVATEDYSTAATTSVESVVAETVVTVESEADIEETTSTSTSGAATKTEIF